MTPAVPVEEKKKKSGAQGSKVMLFIIQQSESSQLIAQPDFILHRRVGTRCYRGLQGLSAGCQYVELEGVRMSCFRVTTRSSFFWCRLGPSAPSSSPQQNLKLDGSARSTPAGRDDIFSKQIWICSAIPADTNTEAALVSASSTLSSLNYFKLTD